MQPYMPAPGLSLDDERAAALMATRGPAGYFTRIAAARHPDDGRLGVLYQNEVTGYYVMWDGECIRSVPQGWARSIAGQVA